MTSSHFAEQNMTSLFVCSKFVKHLTPLNMKYEKR